MWILCLFPFYGPCYKNDIDTLFPMFSGTASGQDAGAIKITGTCNQGCKQGNQSYKDISDDLPPTEVRLEAITNETMSFGITAGLGADQAT